MMPRVQWLGPSDKTADELFAPPSAGGDRTNKVSEASMAIVQQLLSGAKPAAHMDRVRDDASIGDSAWRTARKKLVERDIIAMEGTGRDIVWRLGEGKMVF